MSATMPVDYNSRESRDALRAALSQGVRLGHAGDRPAEGQYNGCFYKIAPGETLVIKDMLDWQHGKKGECLRELPREVVVPAVDLAAELVAETRMGHEGVYIIHGDGLDELRKQTARNTYILWRRGIAEAVQAKVFARAALADKTPGGIPKVLTPKELGEMEWLNRYNRGLIDRLKWISRVDGFHSDSRDEVVRRITVDPTQMSVATQKYGGVDGAILDRDATTQAADKAVQEAPLASQAVEAPVAPPTIKEPVPEAPAGATALQRAAFVMAQAEEVGLNLSKPELKSLLLADEEIINQVADKVADKKVALMEAKGA